MFFVSVIQDVNISGKNVEQPLPQNGHSHHHKSHHHHHHHSKESPKKDKSADKHHEKKDKSHKLSHKSSKDKQTNESDGNKNLIKEKIKAVTKTPTKDSSSGKENSESITGKSEEIGKNSSQSGTETRVSSKSVSVKEGGEKNTGKPVSDVRKEEGSIIELKNEKSESKIVNEGNTPKKDDRQHSSSNKHSSHRSKHHKHSHKDGSESKSSSEHRTHKHDYESKAESTPHRQSKSNDHSSPHKVQSKTKSEQDHKLSHSTTTTMPQVNKESKESKLDIVPTHGKAEQKSSSDHHSKHSRIDSSSTSGDRPRSHHRKKRIVNCGVQVNLRRKTDTKAAQVPEDLETEGGGKGPSDIKISEKKQQRIAYVQQSISNTQKSDKHSKSTPKKQQSQEFIPSEAAVHKLSKDFSNESQDNRLWKTEEASIEKYKYKHLMHVEQYSNGGGLVLHAYQSEVKKLSKAEQEKFALEFMDFCYGEPQEGVANCVMGIVHEAIAHWPDLIEHFADSYPNLTVKAGVLGKSDIETMSMEKFREQVHKSFQAGTFRCGPLLQVSLVGTAQEEVGDYFPEILDMFESDPFLNLVMPWGNLSSVRMASRNMSNDGPILWTRPGEQLIPTADMPKSPFKRKRYKHDALQSK